MRVRVVHPSYIVEPGSTTNQREQFTDLSQWYAVLRRPPETWSVPECAAWALVGEDHGGAGLPWLAQRMQDTCIDGGLLLQLTTQQMQHTLLVGRPADDLRLIQEAVSELRHLTDGIAAGQVLVPMSCVPPAPPPPSTRDILLQGRLPPRRTAPLPWDRDGIPTATPVSTLSPARPQGTTHPFPHPPLPAHTVSGRQDVVGVAGPRAGYPMGYAASGAAGAVGQPSGYDAEQAGAAPVGPSNPGQPPNNPGQPANNLGQSVQGPGRASSSPLNLRQGLSPQGRRVSLSRQEAMFAAAAAAVPPRRDKGAPGPQQGGGAGGPLQQGGGAGGLSQQGDGAAGQIAEGSNLLTAQLGSAGAAGGDGVAGGVVDVRAGALTAEGRLRVELEELYRLQHEYEETQRQYNLLHQGAAIMRAARASRTPHGGPGTAAEIMHLGSRDSTRPVGASHDASPQRNHAAPAAAAAATTAATTGGTAAQAAAPGLGSTAATGATGPTGSTALTGTAATPGSTTTGPGPGTVGGAGAADADLATLAVLGLTPGPSRRTAELLAAAAAATHDLSTPAPDSPPDTPTLNSPPDTRQASMGPGTATAGDQPASTVGPAVKAGPGGRLYPLAAVAAKELWDQTGPYRTGVHQAPLPDVYGTRDIDHVRKVLAQGQSTRVHHTLKSQLSEDVVRTQHGLTPRSTGFDESGFPSAHLALADREVELRLAAGVPVSRALYLATLDTGPRTRQIVQVKAPAPQPNHPPRSAPTTPTTRSPAGSPPPPHRPRAASAHRPRRPPHPRHYQRATRHRHSDLPGRSTQHPISGHTTGLASSGPNHPPAASGHITDRSRNGPADTSPARPQQRRSTSPPDQWPRRSSGRIVRPTMHLHGGPPTSGVCPPMTSGRQGDLRPVFEFPVGQHTVVERGGGRRPWRGPLTDLPAPYPLSGYPGTVAGGPMTKSRAEVIAYKVVEGLRGVTALHHAAQAGHPVAHDLIRQQATHTAWHIRPHPTQPPPHPDLAAIAAAVAEAAGAVARSPARAPAGAGAPGVEADGVMKWSASQRPQSACVVGAGTAGPAAQLASGWDRASWAGETVLHKAARSRDVTSAVMHHALSAGAHVNARDMTGATPLHHTLAQGHWARRGRGEEAHEGVQRVDMLLEAGADPNLADARFGNTALHQALQSLFPLMPPGSKRDRHPHLAEPTKSDRPGLSLNSDLPHVMEQLMLRGARVNARNHRGHTPLHLAAMQLHRSCRGGGHLEAVLRVLLTQGADPNLRDNDGRNALHLLLFDLGETSSLQGANRINHFKQATGRVDKRRSGGPGSDPLQWAVRLLLSHGADITAADACGITPLHLVAAVGSCGLARQLMASCTPGVWEGVVEARDSKKRRPWDVARACGHEELAAQIKPPSAAFDPEPVKPPPRYVPPPSQPPPVQTPAPAPPTPSQPTQVLPTHSQPLADSKQHTTTAVVPSATTTASDTQAPAPVATSAPPATRAAAPAGTTTDPPGQAPIPSVSGPSTSPAQLTVGHTAAAGTASPVRPPVAPDGPAKTPAAPASPVRPAATSAPSAAMPLDHAKPPTAQDSAKPAVAQGVAVAPDSLKPPTGQGAAVAPDGVPRGGKAVLAQAELARLQQQLPGFVTDGASTSSSDDDDDDDDASDGEEESEDDEVQEMRQMTRITSLQVERGMTGQGAPGGDDDDDDDDSDELTGTLEAPVALDIS